MKMMKRQSLIKKQKRKQFELMEKQPLYLGRRFRFIYPTLPGAMFWDQNQNASFTQS
jgi:hypothetical protein